MNQPRASRRHRQSGFTLVEILISMSVGVVTIGLALSTFILGLRMMYKDNVRLQTNANLRYFMAHMSKETLDSSEFYIFPSYTALNGSVSLNTAVSALDTDAYGANIAHGDCVVLVTRTSVSADAAVRQFRIYYRVATVANRNNEAPLRYYESTDYGQTSTQTNLTTLLNTVNLSSNPNRTGSREISPRTKGRRIGTTNNFYPIFCSEAPVLRIPQGGGVDLAGTGYDVGASTPTLTSFSDAFFWDLRRANNNRGGAPFNRSSYPYTPRPIAKVDFDMTRFKMTVERSLLNATSSTIYYPAFPSSSGTWSNFIFNAAATPAAYGLGFGTNFTAFSVQDTVNIIEQSLAGAYAPNQLVISASEQPGSGVVKDYSARFVIADSTDGTTFTDRYTSASDEPSVKYTPSAGKTHLRIRLYLAGNSPAATRLCDEEIIPIVVDGGSTVISALTNDYYVVPTSASGNAVSWSFDNAATDMRVYVGGVDDTANWTFSTTASSGGSGSWGTGLTANRFTPSAITANTASFTLQAKKGATTTSKTMTLVKQSSVTGLASPAQQGRWLNLSTPQAADPFRMYFAPADPANPLIQTSPTTFAVTATDLVNTGGASPWFDGITVYIHSVDAEVRAQTSGIPNRIDSGVRLWNGRGPVISLSGSTYPGRTGLSFATNDAAYIVGHFNADGTINSNSLSTANPGGYSARYPESASEMLTSVMADAITILSQPTFNSSYQQTAGWSDSLSAHRKDGAATYTTSWSTTNPNSSNNRRDGVNTSLVPAAMPNLGNTAPGSGSATTYKFAPTNTEVSTAMLMGLVPTNHNPSGLTDGAPSSGANNQTSGGVHNFPRLSEHWSGVDLYIRGSMVAMFESRVAMEPWSLRVYTAPGRYWGLHESLRTVNHDLPLEPVLLNARRVRFKELTAAEYAAMKTKIEALPH